LRMLPRYLLVDERGNILNPDAARPSSNSDQNNRSLSFSLSPRVGYFALNRLAVGLVTPVGYSWSKREIVGRDITTNFNSFGISAFTRYYFSSAKFTPFVQGEFGYSRYNIRVEAPQFSNPTNSTEDQGIYALGAGVAYFVSPQVAIEGTLDWTNRTLTGTMSDHVLDFRVGLMLYFGQAR
jgi:hypothetical protein